MSIYATLLEFEQEDASAIIGDADQAEPTQQAPYTYIGSAYTADPDLRSGSVELAETAPWCSLHPFIRLGVDDDHQQATVLLGFEQVKEIHACLDEWIANVESGAWRKYGDDILLEAHGNIDIPEHLKKFQLDPDAHAIPATE